MIIITAVINCLARSIITIATKPVIIRDHLGTPYLLSSANFSGTILSFAHAKESLEEARILGFISEIIAIDPANATNIAMIDGRK